LLEGSGGAIESVERAQVERPPSFRERDDFRVHRVRPGSRCDERIEDVLGVDVLTERCAVLAPRHVARHGTVAFIESAVAVEYADLHAR
jgi:hypothetical protein